MGSVLLGHSLPQDWQYTLPLVVSCHRCVSPHSPCWTRTPACPWRPWATPWHLLIGIGALYLLDDVLHGFGVWWDVSVYWQCLGLLTLFCTLWPLLRPTELGLAAVQTVAVIRSDSVCVCVFNTENRPLRSMHSFMRSKLISSQVIYTSSLAYGSCYLLATIITTIFRSMHCQSVSLTLKGYCLFVDRTP